MTQWFLLRRRGLTEPGEPKAIVIGASTEAHARVAGAQLVRDISIGTDHWHCQPLRTQYVIYEGGEHA